MGSTCPSCGSQWSGEGYELESRGVIAGQRVVSAEQITTVRRCSDCGHEWEHQPEPS